MIHISEKCIRSLDQEPGGAMCIQYRYRIQDKSLEGLLKLKSGITVVELLSDKELGAEAVAEFLRIDHNQIVIDKNKPGASKDNPVPG